MAYSVPFMEGYKLFVSEQWFTSRSLFVLGSFIW